MIFWTTNLLATLTGLWMIFDGTHVLRHGKYFGSDMPGPWRIPVEACGLDPSKLGPAFIILGLMWVAATTIYFLGYSTVPITVVAILSLWYFPLGTLFSMIILVMLFFGRTA